MKRIYCDRCGVEGTPRGEVGPRVVTLTFTPMGRTLDLCGHCRGVLDERLTEFVAEEPAPRVRLDGVTVVRDGPSRSS